MKNQKKAKKMFIISCIIILIILQTLPVFFMKPLDSKTLSDEQVVMYYQPGDETGAKEVFDLLKKESQHICEQMMFSQLRPVKAYIYTSQFSLSLREAGLITRLFAPSWYIGDSHNGNIMMVSPNTPVKGHTHDSILNATLHELVHSIVFQINPDLSYFWDNGLATYLAQQKPSEQELSSFPIPSMEDMKTENGLKFGNMGGYAFSYNYIEFLNQKYGWDKVMKYAGGKGTYEEIFLKSEKNLYNEWCQSIKK